MIYNNPNKRGDKSLYVSKGSAEALCIIETDDEEEEGREIIRRVKDVE